MGFDFPAPGSRQPFKKVSPGESAPISASDWNTLMEMASDYRARKRSAGNSSQDLLDSDAGIALMRNDEASYAFSLWDIIGIDGAVLSPVLQTGRVGSTPAVWNVSSSLIRGPVLSGKVPAPKHLGKFGICQEPISPGKIGRVLVAGVSMCRVNMFLDDDSVADIGATNQAAMLQSQGYGRAQILWTTPAALRDSADPTIAYAAVQLGTPVGVDWRGICVGIDVNTWGGGRKRLAVQRLRSMPLNYGGTQVIVDGGIDSKITCGSQVTCRFIQRIVGDPVDAPAYFADPVEAVNQASMVESDPNYVAVVADPIVPVVSTPCPIQT